MRDYEERQQARKERYQARAEQLRAEAQNLNRQASEMARDIPLGQPILDGHYSEKCDRRYRERIHDTFGSAHAREQKADYYEARAGAIGSGGISSDDPKALEKLRAKLAALRSLQERMKKANAIIRSWPPNLWEEELLKLGFTGEQAHAATHPVPGFRPGFESFELQNNSANIRRIANRIIALERARAENVTREVECQGFTLREDAEENRVMFIFEGKPEQEARNLLKANGFKWSPTRGAWVRMLNANGRWAARSVKARLEELLSA